MLRQTASRSSRLLLRAYSSTPSSASSIPPESVVGTQQAPNRVSTWSESQLPRAEAQVGPRFEQTDLSLQPHPYAAIELIAKEPIRYVDSDVAVCDGGRGAQGHPKIYISLDNPGAHACLYCKWRVWVHSVRF